jgi:DNA primase
MSTLFTEAKGQPILAVAERLGLRLLRSGHTVFTPCPDHRNDDGIDEHPSCSLNERTNRFRCWSCGNAGSNVDLVAQVHRSSPADAARWITGQHPLPPPSVLPGAVPRPEYLQAMIEDLLLLCGELSSAAVRYLEGRGIDPKVARRCRVTDVSDYAAVDRGLRERYPRQDLVAAGLFSVKGHLRLFKHTLAFPFLQGGRATYLTARRLDSDEKPKYLSINGPMLGPYNEDIFLEDGAVWIAEGVTDTLTLLSEGLPALGIIGAFGFKSTWAGMFLDRDVRIVLDGDEAGRIGSTEIARLLQTAGANVEVMKLPEEMDVNSYYVSTGLVPHERWAE